MEKKITNINQHRNLLLVRSHTIHREVIGIQLDAYNDLLTAYTRLMEMTKNIYINPTNNNISPEVLRDIHSVAMCSIGKIREATQQVKEVE